MDMVYFLLLSLAIGEELGLPVGQCRELPRRYPALEGKAAGMISSGALGGKAKSRVTGVE
jgi:hypothetical protein